MKSVSWKESNQDSSATFSYLLYVCIHFFRINLIANDRFDLRASIVKL